jgi:sulfur carrier protein ThiS adenylyltransferase
MNAFETALTRYLKSDQLARIRNTTIAIGGAGGLGSNVAMLLVRTGFTRLTIIDKDAVDASNLNRQHYTLADIGKPKASCLKAALLSINPDTKITAHHVLWDVQTTAGLLEGCDIAVEAFDEAATKFSFVEYYRTRARFVVSGNGMAGSCAVTELKTRRVGNVVIVGDGITAAADGNPPLAPRVMECAAKMAQAVLELALS